MFAVPSHTVISPERPAPRHPVRLALAYACDEGRWRHLLRFDHDDYLAALIERAGEHEVWLMAWLPGQRNGPHDHGRSAGAFTVVSGVLTEVVRRRGRHGQVGELTHTVRAGQSRVFGPGYIHEIHNHGPARAISVHVYGAGGRDMRPRDYRPLKG